MLLPVVALGRAQELLLILEDFWARNPDLQRVPIYQASALAQKAMTIYQTYINVLNADMKAARGGEPVRVQPRQTHHKVE